MKPRRHKDTKAPLPCICGSAAHVAESIKPMRPQGIARGFCVACDRMVTCKHGVGPHAKTRPAAVRRWNAMILKAQVQQQ